MSLPSIFDYLPEQANTLMKVAFIDPQAEKKKKEEVTTFSPAVLKAALKTTIPYVLGVPLGAAIGKYGPMLIDKHLGAPLIPPDMVLKYGPAAFMALGGLLAAREASHRRTEREIWRRADKSSQNGAEGSTSEK